MNAKILYIGQPNLFTIPFVTFFLIMERRCLYCQEPLSGRIDKKFCSDQCRNAYNNEKNASKDDIVRKINGILKKNRKLLALHSGLVDKKVVASKLLVNEGFNTQYYTSVLTTKKGHVYYFCYEYGYLNLPPDKMVIVKRNQEEI